MRLLDVDSLVLREFLPGTIPAYAILSHTWEEDEVSFQDIQTLDRARLKKGFQKIEYTCRQAKSDGLSWAWIDTCCIDKTSSAELSEAINSMFRWYVMSEICYAYLSDVESSEDFAGKMTQTPIEGDPRWFRRGWTLQELIAPPEVEFFSANWQAIGSRRDHRYLISCVTKISQEVLENVTSLNDVPIATRMSWASRRRTTRKEDEAYCLLGIFGINMPLLYGEGDQAFRRLQEEILKNIEDQTIFLWQSRSGLEPVDDDILNLFFRQRNFLAASPGDFESCDMFRPAFSSLDARPSITTRERGVRLSVRLTSMDMYGLRLAGVKSSEIYLAGLNCIRNNVDVQNLDVTTRGPPSIAESEKVHVVIFLKLVPGMGDQGRVFTRHGDWYILRPRKEIESWEFSTCYVRDQVAELDPRSLSWRTTSFGYDRRKHFEFVDTYFKVGKVRPGAIWAVVLKHPNQLHSLLVTVGENDSEEMRFLDLWRVPMSIAEQLDILMESQGYPPEYQEHILWEVRAREIHNVAGTLDWKQSSASIYGGYPRASCWISPTLHATVKLIDMEVQISIRERAPTVKDLIDTSESLVMSLWEEVNQDVIPYLSEDF